MTDRASYLNHSASGRTIFPKGPVFTLDNFSSKDFIVKDFIESLTESAQTGSRRSNQGTTPSAQFDPKPLIRSFEQAARRLNELSEDLEGKENELTTAVRRAEANHTNNVEQLGRKLNQTIESFNKLDTSLSERGDKWGGNMAVETGKKLEDLDRQRKRAMDAHFLIECWDEVSNRGEITLLENLRRSATGEGIIRLPTSPANCCGSVKGKREINSREVIEKFIETLENDMLKLFDDFYRRQNFEEMKNCAIILQDFNGGASVQAAFVNQHQFFIDRTNLITEEIAVDQETWMRLSDPDGELPGIEPGLQSLIDEVKVVIQEESAIIKRAFPFPEQVLGKFIQRVFQQSIQQRLELVLEKADSESTLAYLRSLQAARGYLNVLVEDLKAHGLLDHPETASSQTSHLLDQQLEELFTPYFGGSATSTKKSPTSLSYTSPFFSNSTFSTPVAKKNPKHTSPPSATAAKNFSPPPKMSPTQRRMLLSVAGIKDSKTQQNGEIELTETDGRLSVPYAQRMLKWLAEGVRRGLELSGGNETPKDVLALHTLLLTNMGERYIELALDAAAEAASAAESSKREPDLSYLAHLRTAVSCMHLMQSCINTLLIPLASTSLTIRRDMEKSRRAAIARGEDTINNIEQATVDAVLNWVGRCLGGQQRTDFRPRPEQETDAMNRPQTQTCADIIRFLGAGPSGFQGLAEQSLDGANLKVLLSEVAVAYAVTYRHFRKWQVSEVGGVVLARDMSRYVDLLRGWKLGEEFTVGLEVLTELASLFVLKPEALKERIKGGSGAAGEASGLRGVRKEEIRPYLLRREDYDSVGMVSLLSSL
ncbi:Exocyst complex component sec10 [Cyphellophora attinorum]|uniref:Exocyst complex component sec10 n=1 Tax=Cyphellophora attinorum TaxID=1664694 RepID=A0A0N1GZR2_9EURO|nr:Exocyst complex component sec10 [Phialophora attinorum]KPI36655.1 Exocyst complex component sec10 [Phialophora attinorum]